MPCLMLVILCLFGSMIFRARHDAMMRAPLDYPPEALAAKARETAAALGYSKKPADSALWLDERTGLMSYLKSLPEPKKWDEWLAAEPPVMAGYRESLLLLVARPFGEVSRENPAPIKPGMALVRLNANGNLREFTAVPYESGDELKGPTPPEAVFGAAGLEMAAFTETAPKEVPPNASDQVRAWSGPHPKIASTGLTVEVASWKGRITRVIVCSRNRRTRRRRRRIRRSGS